MDSQFLAFLDWPDVLAALAAEALSDRGRAACLHLDFCDSADQARTRAEDVAELVAVHRRDQIWPPLAFPDITPVLDAADRGVALGADELKLLADFCAATTSARRFFATHLPPGDDVHGQAAGRVARMAAGLSRHDALARRARETFDATGEIRDSASPRLAELRRERDGLADRARHRIESLIQSDEFEPHLQDRYVTLRADRFVLPVKASFKSMGLGIVHDTSRTGETVFVEPTALVEMNNRLKVAELEIRHECRRILEELAALVAEAAPDLRRDVDLLTRLDVLSAMARFSVACDGAPAVLSSRPVVNARALRHPLLALRALQDGFAVVANDVSLGSTTQSEAARVLVISGPNAGGKTVLLKAIGLAALCARAGLHVAAAPGCEVGFFGAVLADIGDQQSVLGDLSTFSAHLSNLSRMMTAIEQTGGQPALVLCDELMAGTNPEQGAALARAVLEHLADRPCLVVTTTHYDGLKALADGDPRFRNAGMEYDIAALKPTYRLRDGQPGRSYALDIATIMGMPATVLDRARGLMGTNVAGLETILRQLEEREAALAREEQALVAARTELETRADNEQRATAALVARERELGLRIRQGVEVAVRETREALREIVRNARAQARQKGADAAVATARAAVHEAARAATADLPEAPVLDLEKLRAALANRALGISGSTAGGRVTRSVSRPVEMADQDATVALSRTHGNAIDLRGHRADEALAALDAFLDQALLSGTDTVFIFHGYGTGALKKAVRESLSLSQAVVRFRPGQEGEGGDGVTVAVLRG